ncbi:hypothetical protein AL714_03245 [Clostridium botulinum]|uniref:hypothetical protein n=1 Tax=Clostridium botulinum TaxID=1491 RepID=UPI00099E0548|nr:hypothetical protein [Clostridium botulinum]NFA98081.1 hypothetical protein [Clostridium botulinum]NFB53386.1 hypothetical protein [Clostridium botulinum]NFC87002.1 hypothetical protein [Clostridium botulinum]NFD06647.1 hypothetical protein [Clostridium botulinum]NFD97003.1 hypothetical protein [Clostridium botulinum]
MDNKYNNLFYWENLLIKRKNIWSGNFKDIPISPRSLFINTTIIDYEKNIFDNNWAVYPDAESLLEFVQYIFIPTVLFCYVNNTSEEIVTPIASKKELLEEIKTLCENKDSIIKIEYFINKAYDLSELSGYQLIDELKKYCLEFNRKWEEKTRVFHISIYSSGKEIIQKISKENDFLEVIEEDVGMSINTLKEITKDLHHNLFMKNNFIKILNNQIGCII